AQPHSYVLLRVATTTEIYTLSLHDALPILGARRVELHLQPGGLAGDRRGIDRCQLQAGVVARVDLKLQDVAFAGVLDRLAQHLRSEEHTSELQSRENLVCRLLLEKKK